MEGGYSAVVDIFNSFAERLVGLGMVCSIFCQGNSCYFAAAFNKGFPQNSQLC